MDAIVQKTAIEDGGAVDELDLAIVSALQYVPRASWAPIGQILGVDTATATRHWHRLADNGLAWVSCYPNLSGTVSGWVEIASRPDMVSSVAASLAAEPHAVTVAHIAGDFDLIAAVVTPDDFAFSKYLIEWMNRIPGILRTRTVPFLHSYYVDGSHWRLDGLTASQRAGLRGLQAPRPVDRDKTITSDARPIALALAADGRLPASELGAATGISERTAQRRLAHLVAAKQVVLRAEIARSASGWPVTVIFWARAPASHVNELASRIVGLREVRTCAVTASGDNNIVFSAALRSGGDIQRLEMTLDREMSGLGLRIQSRSLVLRSVKLAGNLLDPLGRRIGTVPMAYWDPIPSAVPGDAPANDDLA